MSLPVHIGFIDRYTHVFNIMDCDLHLCGYVVTDPVSERMFLGIASRRNARRNLASDGQYFYFGGAISMNIFTVSFFGHRQLDNFYEAENELERIITELISQKGYVEFLIGRNGEFDQLVASTIKRVRQRFDTSNNAFVLVLPYMTAEFRDNEESFHNYYDEIEICPASDGAHFKAAMQIRNKDMVDRSDLVVFCVDHASGGAWQTLKYAKKNGANYINVSSKGRNAGL